MVRIALEIEMEDYLNDRSNSNEKNLDVKRKVVRHSKAQINCLNYYYEMGMRGCSKDDVSLIEKAAGDTHLTMDQIKVRFQNA